jgi:unsaturated rhamnogalacturonyl hydrolase
VSEAIWQFLVHFKYLFDPNTGLFFHRKDGGHNFAGALWARGK